MTEPATKAEVEIIALKTVKEVVKEVTESLSKQIVADMTSVCYNIATEVSKKALDNFKGLFENTFHIRMDQPDTIKQMQDDLAHARKLRLREARAIDAESDGRIRMKFNIIAPIVVGIVMFLAGVFIKVPQL